MKLSINQRKNIALIAVGASLGTMSAFMISNVIVYAICMFTGIIMVARGCYNLEQIDKAKENEQKVTGNQE